MSWIVKKPAATEVAPNWLRPYCKQFREELVAQGYAAATMRTYDTATRLLCEEIARRGLRKGEFAGRMLSQVQAAVLKAIHPNKHTYTKYCLARFIDALVQAGAAERPKAPKRVPTALDHLVAEYEAYLREQRGLSRATIYHCVRFLHRFMAFRFGGQLGDMNLITVEDVARFLHEVMSRKSPYRDRTPPTHLRNLFRFLFWSGKTKRDLASCLPRVAIGRASHLPRSLRPEEI
jgi:integrase/recombinase XerD